MDHWERTLTGGGTLQLREASAADAAQVVEHIQQIAIETDRMLISPGEYPLTAAQQAALLETHRGTDNSLYLVAHLDRALAGVTHVSGGRYARVRHAGSFGMSVRRAHWRRGVGRAMLEVVLQWAKDHATLRKLSLQVRADNAPAIALYRAAGFQTEGTLRGELLVNGREVDLLWMGRRV